jgi:hypothetical protein
VSENGKRRDSPRLIVRAASQRGACGSFSWLRLAFHNCLFLVYLLEYRIKDEQAALWPPLTTTVESETLKYVPDQGRHWRLGDKYVHFCTEFQYFPGQDNLFVSASGSLSGRERFILTDSVRSRAASSTASPKFHKFCYLLITLQVTSGEIYG